MPATSLPPAATASAAPRLSVLLLGPDIAAARDTLAGQTLPADQLEWLTATTHADANAALLRARGEVITLCDGTLVLPAHFGESIVASFDDGQGALSRPLLLQHRLAGHEPDPRRGACLSMRRVDALRLGGLDEHADFADAGAPFELGWRLINAGIEAGWHPRVTLDQARPVPRREAALAAAQGALSSGRLLPLQENPAVHAARLAQRRPGSETESRLAGAVTHEPTVVPVAAAASASTATPQADGLDWRDIPVFIVNRNRLDALRRLVGWLLAAGTRRVVIMDNASDYPPLLAWYEQLPEGAKLMRLEQNHGPYVLWQQGVHQVLDTPYVLTDSDVVPDAACPGDLIGRLLEVLQRHPDAKKVGPGLRIDNLPDSYAEADTVRKWESQFWEHPVAPGVFAAPIDTTFALYPARGEFSNEACNLRLGAPYLTEHTPWYVDEAALSAEERHYREHTSATFSNWSVAKKDSWVKKSERVAAFELRAKVLHVDGGREYIPGWINAGHGAGRFDIAFDLQACRAQKLPLADSTLDGIHLSHVLEGVRDAQALFEELYRVAKPDAKLFVRVAHGARDDAWQDAAQQRVWTEGSFAHFAQPVLPEGTAYRGDWALESVRLVADAGAAPIDEVIAGRNRVREMVVELRAVKPARAARGQHPAAQVRPTVVTDGRIDPRFGVLARAAA
ncbi:glycosyltransferase [Rhizobacter sp. AJA081-3]|uniref:methyltransferase domain-containing protein n=1 Tax=Rhizobacter sp. AJA081-3 TaxID=2753607 RepID=UPI001ADEDADA|nr:methyltransferase domain-containing protein [Rhizobacter sp. AJA081-3]QTN24056.1 glycosyltransferase [Rhizobacter sp. AJA081-3]